MKNYFRTILLSIFLLPLSCDNNSNKKDAKSENPSSSSMMSTSESPAMSFDKTLHDFGTIQEGETVETIFTFTNTGKSDLIIVDARGSCGCTVPEYPKDKEIKPGESGVIKARFDSAGQTGKQVKSITLTTNTENSKKIIRMSGFVINK